MAKKLMYVMALVALCAGLTHAELVGHWSLDEGSGSIAHDGTGNGHDGELIGDPQWVEAQYGMGLEFAGNPDKVDIPYSEQLNPETAFSLSLWTKPDSSGSGHRSPITSRDDFPQRGYIIYIEPGNTWQYWLGIGSWNNTQGPAVEFGEWTHVAATYDNGAKKFYLNGAMVAEGTGIITPNTEQVLRIGGGATEGNGNYFWVGTIDDVAIFDHTLTDAEVQQAMKGLAPPELAANPVPEDAAVDVPRNVTLDWAPGDFAVQHDVYFGTTFEDVNTASVANPLDVLAGQGQTANAYDAGILEFGQTYYWRVDEVNGAPDQTVFKGNVWSFTIEPLAIPVEAITVTASSSNGDMGPENTIGGVGLNELDQHSTEGTDMWLSGVGDPTPSIQYAFDKAYKLHEMLVWNSNQLIESFVGIGAKDVAVETSLDGAEWTVLEGATLFNQATGTTDYTANTSIDFAGAMAQYVRITVSAGYGLMPQYGISEVRFLYVPTFAREAQPADGAITDAANVLLSWRAGREAVSHEISLGTDAENLDLITTTTEPSYAANGLDYATTYYWSVTEVNEAEAVSAHTGDIWSFTTPDFGTVDGFEQYDDNCNRIFFAWGDGLGHNGGEEVDDCDVLPSNGNGGGSIVGNAQAAFAERSIVHSGSQSLPLEYDNAFGPSEAILSLAGQDWTASGVQTLAIAFSGTAGNTGTLYVKINNTKVTYDRDPADIARSGWQAWNIDLSAVSGLQNVTSLTIGVDGASAAGMLYIDDIRLYPVAGELITPVDPGNAGLVAVYSFEGNADDSSGNGHNGTVEGAASFAAGHDGSALDCDGFSAYVSTGKTASALGIDGNNARTVACWAYTRSFNNGGLYDVGNRSAGQDFCLRTMTADNSWRIQYWGGDSDFTHGTAEKWVHFTHVHDGTNTKIYADGVLIVDWEKTINTTDDNPFQIGCYGWQNDYFDGMIDELHLYDRALSAEEALFMAGRAESIHKPF